MDSRKKIFRGSAVLLLVGIVYFASVYNAMVGQHQAVKTSWSQVENAWQRRADLIPNLVKTVKAYSVHEKETLIQVVKARAAAIQTQQTTPSDSLPTPSQLQQIETAQQALSSSLGKLLVVVEKYPDLKASQNFLALQAELAGTENRIAVERRRFNLVAQSYNTYILRFPHNLVARLFHFKPEAYFTAKPEAEKVPEVDFSN